MELTLDAARAIRDGGIDAVAALDLMLAEALQHLPDDQHADIKTAIGRVIVQVMKQTIDPATAAFPELKPDEQTWVAVVRAKALKRSSGWVTP